MNATLAMFSLALRINFLTSITMFIDKELLATYEPFFKETIENYAVQVFSVDSPRTKINPDYTGLNLKDLNTILIFPENHLNLYLLAMQSDWNARGRTLVLTKELNSIIFWLSGLWNATRAVNVAVMVLEPTPRFFTWFPYRPDCKFSEIKEIFPENLFPNKIPRNLHGCPIYAAKTPLMPFVEDDERGLEVQLFRTILSKYNAKPKYKNIPNNETVWAVSETCCNLRGGIKMLAESEVDVIFSSLDSSFFARIMADVLPTHTYDGLAWFVPLKPIPAGWRIVKALPMFVWVGISIATLFIFFLINLGEFLKKGHIDFIRNFIKTISLSLNQSEHINLGWTFRPAIVIIYIYSLHITSAYQSTILSILYQKPNAPLAASTLEEIANSNLQIFYHKSYHPYLNRSDFHLWEKLLDPKRSYFVDRHPVIEIVLNTTSMLLGPRLPILLMLRTFHLVNTEGELLIQPLPEFVEQTGLSIWMSLGHPLYNMMEIAVLQVNEAGLPEYWLRDYLDYTQKFDQHFIRQNHVSPLEMSHLNEAFYTLVVLLPASVAFISEIIFSNFCHRRVVANKVL